MRLQVFWIAEVQFGSAGGVLIPAVKFSEWRLFSDLSPYGLFHPCVSWMRADAMYGTPWFGGNESAPTGSRDESAELIHAVRRLSAHPSIFAWNGAER